MSTSLKVAGVFADFGTGTTVGVGVASALASLGLKLAALGVDIRDMWAGNRRLAKPDTLDLTVFEECPILGCYLLICADTSQVINFFLPEFGLPGWTQRLEEVKRKKMDPLLGIAATAIRDSRLQLDGLSSTKGVYMAKGHFAQIKSKAVKLVTAH